jgi:allantoin racemase
MKINIILPTSNPDILSQRQVVYSGLARSETKVSISILDERVPLEADPSDSFILPEILEKIVESENNGMDAVIVDCMEDPGVEEGRRLVDIPVVGPGHAAMNMAVTLGHKFSILYPMKQLVFVRQLVEKYQLSSMLASIKYLPCGLEGIITDAEGSMESLQQTAIAAIVEDGATVIVPFCSLTSPLIQPLQQFLHEKGHPVPVIDGAAAAVKLAENLVDMGLSHSRVTYPLPLGISERIA